MPASIVLLLLLSLRVANAQVGPRAGGPTPADQGSYAAIDVSFAANLARGVADRDLITARGQLTLWDGPWGLFVEPYGVWGDSAGKNTDDERFLRIVAFRALSNPAFVFGVLAVDHSLRRKIDERATSGGGVGLTLVESPRLTMVSSIGLIGEVGAYEGTTLADGTLVAPVTRHRARVAFRLFGRYQLANRLTIIHDVHVLPNVRDVRDVRLVASAIAEIPILGGFAARVQLDATYEQVIVPGTKHGDVSWMAGASYKHDWR
jgi:hypothetical protein